ncbi:MAG: hypothetical protein ABIR11_00075 [Candidatus Limnocylindrales bacterium]
MEEHGDLTRDVTIDTTGPTSNDVQPAAAGIGPDTEPDLRSDPELEAPGAGDDSTTFQTTSPRFDTDFGNGSPTDSPR